MEWGWNEERKGWNEGGVGRQWGGMGCGMEVDEELKWGKKVKWGRESEMGGGGWGRSRALYHSKLIIKSYLL